MKTLERVQTHCGVVLCRDGSLIYPLTRCHQEPVGWAGHCPTCFLHHREGYDYAVTMGSRNWLAELRQMMETIGCTTPSACRDSIAARFSH